MEQAIFSLEMHGFAVVPDVLSSGEVAALRALNERVHAAHGQDERHYGLAGHVTNLARFDPGYWPVIDHPRVLPVLEAVLGPELILASLNSRIVRPGEGPQRFHSDVPPAIRRLGPAVMLNTVWMLDEFSIANGATRIVPGSHRYPDNPSSGPKYAADDAEDRRLGEELFPAPAVVSDIVGGAGSVAIFDGRCWHAGGRNATDRPRHGLFGNYRMGTWMRFQVDPHQGFPPDWVARLNARQRQLMRMEKGVGHPTGSDWREE